MARAPVGLPGSGLSPDGRSPGRTPSGAGPGNMVRVRPRLHRAASFGLRAGASQIQQPLDGHAVVAQGEPELFGVGAGVCVVARVLP